MFVCALDQVEMKEVELYKPCKKNSLNLLNVCLVIKCLMCGVHCSMFGA